MKNPSSEFRLSKVIRSTNGQTIPPARGHASSFGFRRSLVIGNSSFVIAFVLLASSLGLHAQSYSIDWFTVDGGGGTSTGSVFQVSGTIGQPDAGPAMSGGNFSVTGGFWSLVTAVQTAGAPRLTIAPATPGNATISWSPATPGYVLQESWSLSSPNWTNSTSGATNPITVPAINPSKFYRLSKP